MPQASCHRHSQSHSFPATDCCCDSTVWLQVRELVAQHNDGDLKTLLREVALEWQPGEADARADAIDRLTSHIFHFRL